MATPEEHCLEIHGIRTRYLQAGAGPPLVYLHGAGGGQWYPFHDLLAEHFTVYAPDHPGWGGSDHAEWMDTMQDYVLHYESFLRILKLDRPILVGHSLGGWMASNFAYTYPGLLRGLVLVNSAGYPIEANDPAPDFFAVVARGGQALADMLFHKTEAKAQFLEAKPTPEEILARYRAQTSTARLAWHLWFDEKMPQRLGRIDCPSLILWGRHDQIFCVEHGCKFAAGIPNARLQVIEDCGHMAPMEDPMACAGAVIQFAAARA